MGSRVARFLECLEMICPFGMLALRLRSLCSEILFLALFVEPSLHFPTPSNPKCNDDFPKRARNKIPLDVGSGNAGNGGKISFL